MKTKILAFVCLSLFSLVATAQSALQVKDILVTPSIEIDSISGLPVDNDVENFDVFFKVNDLSAISNVHILVGTSPNSGDILLIEANLLETDGNYHLVYNGFSEMLIDNIIKVKISLNNLQYTSYSYISAYVSNASQQTSNVLIFTK
ncbi:MAG TPA: hypothetical protein PLK75_12825 [Bacteroidales bacterium]|nr:hypothetical protein [Bacteroidales bacterium]